MKQSSNTPSEQDFSRAKQKMRERSEKGKKLKAQILINLPSNQPCHDIWVWPSDDQTTVSYIYPTDSDHDKGENQEIEYAIKSAAQSQGIENISIDYHSHENVLKKHNGNYGKYFR